MTRRRAAPQFMGACTLDSGDTAILMELMLGGNLYEAIAGDRVSWYNRWALPLSPTLS